MSRIRRAALPASGGSALLLAGCEGLQSALDPAGASAALIADLWWFMLVLGTAVFLAVAGFLFFALYRGRREEGREMARDDARSTRVVVAGVAATVVILFAVFLYGQSTANRKYGIESPRPLVIEVTGHQWWWEVTYDDPVPSRRLRTANEIHLPVGRPVLLKLETRDVIHSFWVPSLSGKMDLMPGRTNTKWLRADRPGVFRGQCAEFCGMQHAKMALVVVAEPEEEFAAWYEQQLQPAPPPADALAALGEEVFLRAPCAMCHAIRGTPAAGTAGPDLTHMGSRRIIAAGALPNRRGHLAGWIMDPQHVKPGNFMPAVDLQSEELQALLHYLTGLR